MSTLIQRHKSHNQTGEEPHYLCASPYISDIDFPLGDLVISWSLAEPEEVFSERERLLITATLLALCRQVHGYAAKFWPVKPDQLRFNHETFPALSLLRAARYFGHCYKIPDVRAWQANADLVFTGPVGKVFKHVENASGYQWIVPMHKFMYDVATGSVETLKNRNICKTAYAAVAVTDNFGIAVDYGDATDNPVGVNTRILGLLDAAASAARDGTLAWVAEFLRSAAGDQILKSYPPAGQGLPGQNTQAPGNPPETGDWETPELDDHIRAFYQPDLAREYVADKIGFRTGWTPEVQFLLFEPQSVSGHIHYDMNAILRYNHRGRVWIVDNGYGRPSRLSNVSRSYSERQRGPEDHNVVIFRDRQGEPVIPPPFGAIITCRRAGELLLLQSALCQIDGADWLRTIVLVFDRLMLVVDQVRASGRESVIECQFNALGDDVLDGKEWRLEQQGGNLFGPLGERDERGRPRHTKALGPLLRRFPRQVVHDGRDLTRWGMTNNFRTFLCRTLDALLGKVKDWRFDARGHDVLMLLRHGPGGRRYALLVNYEPGDATIELGLRSELAQRRWLILDQEGAHEAGLDAPSPAGSPERIAVTVPAESALVVCAIPAKDRDAEGRAAP